MKKITALLGLVGAVGMFVACADDTVSGPTDDNAHSTYSSSSVDAGDNNDDLSSSSTAHGTKDSVVHQTVVIVVTSSGSHEIPYSSSGTFCWSSKCSAAEAPKSSSSISIDITMSSEAQQPQLPPIVNGNSMTDQRDNKTYKLANVAGKLWMAENINYETKNGYYCTSNDGENICSTYGGFYSLTTAKKICPENWRLPTYEEFEAAFNALEDDEDFWTKGGRFKLEGGDASEFGQAKEQGYLWVTDDSYNNVQIQSSTTHKPLSASDRAYNVRCVSDQ